MKEYPTATFKNIVEDVKNYTMTFQIEEVRDEEQEKLDNANEGQLATERFQTIEEGCDTLSELYDSLESIKDEIDDAYNDDGFEL